MGDRVPGLVSPWTRGELKYRLFDEAMKSIYLEALTRHPFAAARFYLIHQPPHLIGELVSAFTNAETTAWAWLILLPGASVLAFVSLLGGHNDASSFGKVILLSGTLVAVSCLPNIWAYASLPSMPDTILLSVCFVSLALGFGARTLFRRGQLIDRYTCAWARNISANRSSSPISAIGPPENTSAPGGT